MKSGTGDNINSPRNVTKANYKMNKQMWTVAKTLETLVENPLETLNDDKHGQKRKLEEDEDDSNKRLKTEDGDGSHYNVVSTYNMDRFDRRWLMLNGSQMICESIPMPIDEGNSK